MERSSRRITIAAITSLVLITAMTTAWLLARPAAARAGGDLVVNPGFETGNLSGWTCDPGTVVVTNPVHSGNYAAQLNPTNSTIGAMYADHRRPARHGVHVERVCGRTLCLSWGEWRK